jgi:hypothetical protein
MSEKKIDSCKSFTLQWTFNNGAEKLAVEPAKDNFAARFSQLSWKEKLSRFVYGTLGFHSAFHLLDNGLANFLALDILKHGTSIKAYISIFFRGADPKMGGSNQGVYSPGSPNCTNQFYVMPNSAKSPITAINSIYVPAAYTHMASATMLGHKAGDGGSLKAALLGFCTPTLRFKFRPEDVKTPRFEETNRVTGALYTTHSISPGRLGIFGSLRQGIGLSMFRRMARHPHKVLGGIAMIGGAAYIAKRTYTYVTSKPQPPSPERSIREVAEEVVSRPKVLMNPTRFAVICGIYQSFLTTICLLPIKTFRNSLVVLASSTLMGVGAYFWKREYNLIRSKETRQQALLRAEREEETRRKAKDVLKVYALFYRAVGAYLLGVV